MIANPDELPPRLAFADACELEGDRAHAVFIRWQLEARAQARLGRDWSTPATHAADLLRGQEARWAGPLHGRVPWYDFFGGFSEAIKLDATDFLAQAGELYELAPVRRLFLTGVVRVAEQLFRSPYLSRIVYLAMSVQGLADRHMEMLAASPHLGNLQWLVVNGNDVGIRGVEALAASANLPLLQLVDLHSNPADVVQESVGNDQGMIIDASGTLESQEIERRHGRKTWLHTVEDHGLREMIEYEL